MAADLTEIRTDLQSQDIDILRLVYPDVLGIVRSKDLMVSQLERAAAHGPAFCQGVWVTTTRGGVLDGHGSISDGLPDLVSRLDASTIRPMPWEPGLAMAIADAYEPDGSDSPIAPRSVLRRVVEEFTASGLTPIVGPELEFYLAEQVSGTWQRVLNKTGRVYTTGTYVDEGGTFLRMLRMVDQFSIGAFAGNHEFCPSQYEINLWHSEALDAADRTFLLKTAVRDIAAQDGLLATFLGKPWNDEGGSGFHVHFSVNDKAGNNTMHAGGEELSGTALAMIAGIIEHAAALSALTNPTINAFKRLGPDTLAPYRANWGYDNRSTMIRVPPERGQGTRLELRIGDGAGNPYVVIAAVLAAALDGIRRNLTPPPALAGWTYEDPSAPVLPMTLAAALEALAADQPLREMLGSTFVETFVTLKQDEIQRYLDEGGNLEDREVSAWEIAEYLEDY
ncbi:MAG: glutamine synthetase family protein [Actinomycetales bacterium]|nr:glutamine synthetase family protein [Actinomycetales bacterium]